METRANYVLVGAFVLLVVGGLIGFVIWLGKAQFDREFAQYKVLFRGSVTGLKEANPVRYRGVPVGSVTGIRINPENVEEVEVLIQVTRDTPIKEDTEASLEFQGITGVAYVQLSGGSQAMPPLEAGPDGEPPVIQSKPSQLEKVIKAAPELIQQFIVLVDRATQLLGEANQKSIAGTLDNLEVHYRPVRPQGRHHRGGNRRYLGRRLPAARGGVHDRGARDDHGRGDRRLVGRDKGHARLRARDLRGRRYQRRGGARRADTGRRRDARRRRRGDAGQP